jgi:hypothetical protein
LQVTTVPLEDAFAATTSAARKKGAVRLRLASGSTAYYERSHPETVFLARAGSRYQVQVTGTSATQARRLVSAGRVVAVEGARPTIQASLRAATPRQLRALARNLHHPLYWLGRQPGVTYELTQAPGGKVYIRYLPAGEKLGTNTPYPTVGTYPVQNAYAAMQRLAKGTPSLVIHAPGRALAVVDAGHPTNVHLAYPGSNYQIEVFDSSPTKARKAVATGEVQAVR